MPGQGGQTDSAANRYVAWAIAGAAMLFLALLLPGRIFDPDEFEHVQAAWLMRNGQVPYRDFFEHHLPLYPALLAPFLPELAASKLETAWAFLLAARWTSYATAAALLGATAAAARGAGGPVAAAAAAAILAINHVFQWKAIEIRPDVLATLLVVGSYLLLTRPGRRRFALAGLLAGLALLATQKTLFVLPGLAAVGMIVAWRAEGRWRLLAAAVIGGLVPIGVLAAVFAGFGALSELVHYNFLLNAAWPVRMSPLVVWKQIVIGNPEVPVLGVLGAGALVRRWRERDTLLPLLPLASLAAGLAVVPIPQQQYWLMLLPFAAVLCGCGFARLLDSSRRPGVAALVLAVVFGHSAWRNAPPQLVADNGHNRAMLRLVIEGTPPAARVLDTWTSGLLFRHGVFFHWFLHGEIARVLTPAQVAAMEDSLISGAACPEIVGLSEDEMAAISPRMLDFVKSRYAPTVIFLWRRVDGACRNG